MKSKARAAAWLCASAAAIAFALVSSGTVYADHGGTHPPSTECPWDVNGDGVVDRTDVLAVIEAFGTPSTAADVNSDGAVDHLDMIETWDHLGACDNDDDSGPPTKPAADWLLAVLDGNASARNTAAISKNH